MGNFEREIAEDIVVLDRSNVIIKNQRDVLNKRSAIEYQERVRMERKRKFDATVKSQQVQNSEVIVVPTRTMANP